MKEKRNFSNNKWLIWAILAFIYLIVFFHRMSVGVIREDLISTFKLDASSFALFGSIYFYVYMFMQIPAGILADTLGARVTVTLGSIISGIGAIALGSAPNLLIAYLGRFLVGLGASVVFIPILTIQSKWFEPKKFGTMTGITAFVGNLGSVIAQTPLAILVVYFSWRSIFIGIGVVSVLLGGVCYLIVRNSPEEKLDSHSSILKTSQSPNGNLRRAFASVIGNRHSWPPAIVFMLVFGSYVAFTGTFGQKYLMDLLNLDRIQASNYTLINAITLSFAALFIGKISDKLMKRKPILIAITMVNMVAWYLLVIRGHYLSNTGLVIAMIALGIGSCVVVLCLSLAKELNSPRYVGISTSTTNIIGFAGAAIIPMIVGKTVDRLSGSLTDVESLKSAFLYCFLASVLAVVFSLLIKETNCINQSGEINQE